MRSRIVRRQASLVALCLILSAPVALPEEAQDSPETVRSLLAKWAETQQMIAKERSDWKDGKEILQSRIDLLRGEIATAEGKLSEISNSGGGVRKDKSELNARIDTMKEVSGELGRQAGELETRLRALHDRLPDPLKEKIRPRYGRMPDNPAQSAISAAERFQNVAGILTEINKFNGEITLTSEVRTLTDGKPAEVKVVYVGLGQAYFVGAQGQAGVGRPSEKGWEWKNEDRIAAEVSQVVEVLQNKAKPSFVLLPVEIR